MRWLAALAGFLLSWQTVWILRPGTLGGVPWPLATIGVYASDAVLLAAAVVGVVRAWRGGVANPRGWPIFPRRHLLLSFGLLLALAAVNTWVSADSDLSTIGWVRLIAFLFAIAGLPYSRKIARAFLGGFVIAMLGHAVIGIVQFFALSSIASTLLGIAPHAAWTLGDSVIVREGERWLRAYGGFPHPNVFGAALLVALLSLPVISTGAKRGLTLLRKGSDPFSLTMLSLEMTIWVIFTAVLLLTFSRAALLGLGVLLVACACQRAMRRFAVIGTVVAVIGIALTWSFWVPRVAVTGANEARSRTERTDGFRGAGTLLREHPLIGVGLHAMPRALIARTPARDPYTAQPVHNAPLLALVEIGAVGVLVFVFMLIFFIASLRHDPCSMRNSPFLFVLLPSLLFDHFFWSLPVGLALFFVLAVSMSLDRKTDAA
ncbi:O-antigen ligase family protein [Candidatus Uhrbacteria bacterium]|nr:O-antigen ligase family protein [Candidatus Uhrbacteria bacterium]